MSGSVSFLLGAGASVPAGIPHVRRFFADFRDHIALQAAARPELLTALEGIADAWRRTQGYDLEDLERLYELMTHLNAAEAQFAIPLGLPPDFPARSRAIELLEWELKKYVQERCLAVRAGDLGYLRPLSSFSRLGRPLGIVSLNYDACVEMVLDGAGLTWSDGGPPGDSEFFASRVQFPPGSDVHLIKLHGSATWYHTRFEEEPGWMRRARGLGQVGVSRLFGAARTLTHEAMMVYPTLHKALTNGPFPVLAHKAQRVLADSQICLAIGYSFGDVHVRRLVLEALSRNPDLRLVLVNPAPVPVLEALYRDAGGALHERIGTASDPFDQSGQFGRVEQALAGDWLLHRCEEWLRGAPIVLPLAASRGKKGGPTTPIKSCSPWELKWPIDGGVSGIARENSSVYIARPGRREIGRLDAATGAVRTAAGDLDNLRGLAFDPLDRLLYAVSNRYRAWPRRAPWGRGGIGQLWAIDPQSGVTRSVTRIDWIRTLLRFANKWTQVRKEGYWKNLVGGLRWPSSVIVEEPGRSLLFTEARAVRRFDLRSGAVSTAVNLALPFNLVGLALEAPKRLLVADAGVHPRGFGRLLRVDLATQNIDVVAEGWSGFGALGVMPQRRIALLTRVGPWPRGSAMAVDLDRGKVVFTWQGLNRPGHLCVSADEKEVLVATADGIVELLA